MATRHARIVDRVATRLKLRQLRLLVAVERHGSIQYAARDLNVSQPSATKMIKDLELDFEVQLFERTNRGVVPTPFGEVLIRNGKLILAQISNAAQELDDPHHELHWGEAGLAVERVVHDVDGHVLVGLDVLQDLLGAFVGHLGGGADTGVFTNGGMKKD